MRRLVLLLVSLAGCGRPAEIADDDTAPPEVVPAVLWILDSSRSMQNLPCEDRFIPFETDERCGRVASEDLRPVAQEGGFSVCESAFFESLGYDPLVEATPGLAFADGAVYGHPIDREWGALSRTPLPLYDSVDAFCSTLPDRAQQTRCRYMLEMRGYFMEGSIASIDGGADDPCFGEGYAGGRAIGEVCTAHDECGSQVCAFATALGVDGDSCRAAEDCLSGVCSFPDGALLDGADCRVDGDCNSLACDRRRMPFLEVAGRVAFEAESYAWNAGPSSSGDRWTATTDTGASAGVYMVTGPEGTDHIDAASAADGHSTYLHYDVDFTNPGTYRIWIRGRARGETDESVHVGFIDAFDGFEVVGANVSISSIDDGTWQWTSWASGSPLTTEVPAAGMYTFAIAMSVDGASVDKIYLTSAGFELEPAQSEQEGVLIGGDGCVADSQCRSRDCTAPEGLPAGSFCASDDDCAGDCEVVVPPGASDGAACSSDGDCSSGDCDMGPWAEAAPGIFSFEAENPDAQVQYSLTWSGGVTGVAGYSGTAHTRARSPGGSTVNCATASMPTSCGGYSQWTFVVETAGDYTAYLRMSAKNWDGNNVGSGNVAATFDLDSSTWTATTFPECAGFDSCWTWTAIAPVPLLPGRHTVEVWAIDNLVKFDKLLVASSPPTLSSCTSSACTDDVIYKGVAEGSRTPASCSGTGAPYSACVGGEGVCLGDGGPICTGDGPPSCVGNGVPEGVCEQCRVDSDCPGAAACRIDDVDLDRLVCGSDARVDLGFVHFTGRFLNRYPPKLVAARAALREALGAGAPVRQGLGQYGFDDGLILHRGLHPTCAELHEAPDPSLFDTNAAALAGALDDVVFLDRAPLAEALDDAGCYLAQAGGDDELLDPTAFPCEMARGGYPVGNPVDPPDDTGDARALQASSPVAVCDPGQRTYAVLITDGRQEPTLGVFDPERLYYEVEAPTVSSALADVAAAAYATDHRADLDGVQDLVTYVVALGVADPDDPARCDPTLAGAAEAGGGRCFSVHTEAELRAALLAMVAEITSP